MRTRGILGLCQAPQDLDSSPGKPRWHRTAIPDLFIAETALSHDAGVLHRDRDYADYARIAEVRRELVERQLA